MRPLRAATLPVWLPVPRRRMAPDLTCELRGTGCGTSRRESWRENLPTVLGLPHPIAICCERWAVIAAVPIQVQCNDRNSIRSMLSKLNLTAGFHRPFSGKFSASFPVSSIQTAEHSQATGVLRPLHSRRPVAAHAAPLDPRSTYLTAPLKHYCTIHHPLSARARAVRPLRRRARARPPPAFLGSVVEPAWEYLNRG